TLTGVFKQRMQCRCDGGWVIGTIASLAPAEAGAIVAADARDFGNRGLHPSPGSRHAGSPGFQYHRRRSLAGAVDVQLMTAHIDETARVTKLAPLERSRDALIGGAGEHEEDSNGSGSGDRAAYRS